MKCLSTHSGSTREKAGNYEEINCLARLLRRETQQVTHKYIMRQHLHFSLALCKNFSLLLQSKICRIMEQFNYDMQQ
jgi:hypothetical protein